MEIETNKCNKCCEVKLLDNFYRDRKSKTGRRLSCKECDFKKKEQSDKEGKRKAYVYNQDSERWRRVKSTYNLTRTEYFNILSEQQGKCAICKEGQLYKTIDHLFIDHCHTTKKIRGLLCHRCNVALGLFRDDISLLSRAIKYLEK